LSSLARITVLISGRGSNLDALIQASRDPGFRGAITHVVSNRADAGGLAIAQRHGIAASVVEHRAHATRAAFEAALAGVIDDGAPDLLILAGFMRVLGDAFVRRYEGRMINVHPSLLPAYPGLDTHARALRDGVRIHGCSVHFVTATVDAGPIVAQAAVPVLPSDDEATLAARVLRQEHRLLPAAARWFCAGQLSLVDGRVQLDVAGAVDASAALPVPAPDPI
jgi:phosphoribosylglycinamide formyltransferase-1